MDTVHLIISSDDSYNSAVVRRLIIKHGVRKEAIDIFDGKILEQDQFENALYTNSLISSNKAIVINNAEKLKADIIALIEHFAGVPQEQVLVILVSEDVDVAKKKLNSIKSIRKHILTNITTYSLIQSYIKEYNIKITKTAIDMLANTLEIPKWGIVENEFNKLSTYVGKDNVINEDAVSELTINLNRSDTFKFVSEIINLNKESALKSLQRLKESGGDNAMIIGALLWKLRQMVPRTRDNADLFIRQFELIYEYTLAIRTGRLNNNIALDILAMELLHRKPY